MQDQKVHKNLLNSVFVLTLMTNQNEMTTYTTSTSIDIAVEEHHEIIIITKIKLHRIHIVPHIEIDIVMTEVVLLNTIPALDMIFKERFSILSFPI